MGHRLWGFAWTLAAVVLLAGLLLVVASGDTWAAGVWYVTVSGTSSEGCTSWADACDLQTALGKASDGVEVWLAEGVYTPGPERTDTFQLVGGVGVYGGFAGTETGREQRDPAAHVTVLSGDIAGDDTTDPHGVVTNTDHISGTNSYHVVTGSGVTGTAVLDGFTITAGQANVGSQRRSCGGGMFNEAGSPALSDVTFIGNYASQRGGGMYNNESSPTLTDVTFTGNKAHQGGGMVNLTKSSPTLTGVTFSHNTAPFEGGGMVNQDRSRPVLADVTFSDNEALQGGGMVNWAKSHATLTDVTFSGNMANDVGGGMCNGNSSPTLTNVIFSGNSVSAGHGGGMHNSGGSPALTNVLFSGNSAQDGGGMYNRFNSSLALTNVTFSGNQASNLGGGAHVYDSSSLTLTNCILWGNTAGSGGAQIYNSTGSTSTIAYSDVEGSGGSGTGWDGSLGSDGGGNLDDDPLFVDADGDDNTAGTLDDDLHLQRTSPAVDKGDDSAVPPGVMTDLDGNPRIRGAAVDMGAYEFQPVFRIYLPWIVWQSPL